MKLALTLLGALSICFSAFAQDNKDLKYHYKVDLNKVVDDQLSIQLDVPNFNEEVVYFQMPKMVPGTYSIYDFGRFVTEFKALDANGKELKVERKDDNTWKIDQAKELRKLVYRIEDSWDTKLPNVVFEPAGTNIDADKVFVFNNHGIFGFFKGHERHPFHIEIDRPAKFFGGTAMKRIGGDEDTDIFLANDYGYLVDSPIMFCEPDTAIFQVGNATVLIQTYSPKGRVKSKDLVNEIKPTLEAQREYLGGTLPVDYYAFLIFLNKPGQGFLSGSAGALEHSYSSFYCLFEGESKDIAQTVRDVAAHEFFHIVTPLSIHSEEIHYFDFIEPKMSKHLWLYEGVTEYSAQHVQVKQGMVSLEHFLNEMSKKMATADYFKKDLSFTEMSMTCLDANKKQYPNVYMKGALIGMCVDLKLRVLSKGAYGIQNLMQDLSKKYGIEKPFKDDELFDEIAAISGFPEMKAFLDAHVGGIEPLPIQELMEKAGISYSNNGFLEELSVFGFDPQRGIGLDFNKNLLKLANENALDDFGAKELKLKEGDVFYKWDGEELTMANVQSVLTAYAMRAKEGYELKITVLRPEKAKKKKKKKNTEPKYNEVELSGKLRKVRTPQKHAFNILDTTTEEQMLIRKSWLGDYKMKKDLPSEK